VERVETGERAFHNPTQRLEEYLMSAFLKDFNINDPYYVVPLLMLLMIVLWIVALFADRPPE
jgi:membrane protein insertase Oxa1/YidC/SpoIIIJ